MMSMSNAANQRYRFYRVWCVLHRPRNQGSTNNVRVSCKQTIIYSMNEDQDMSEYVNHMTDYDYRYREIREMLRYKKPMDILSRNLYISLSFQNILALSLPEVNFYDVVVELHQSLPNPQRSTKHILLYYHGVIQSERKNVNSR